MGIPSAPWHAPALHEPFHLSYVTITVVALTADGRPAGVAFHFKQPLEAPQLIWFRWQDRRFVPFTPPPVGGQTWLAPTLP
ncbi:MAG: hypothetical protein AB4911_17530 [Oscillochloridaceae bacterium umkhey_bin13]